ncbi:MAG: hypothetical protein FWG26_00550 [Betaproteobacteria bacterium]|nr:hypothetical protein [Betaproteobacteria bacterium]
MMPGPDQIIACPYCAAQAKYKTLISGNTIGARTWSDGKQIAPMLPRPPAVVKCHHCERCYWLDDAEEISETGERKDAQFANRSLTTTPVVKEPGEMDYYKALANGLATTPEEGRHLRILARWRRNDPLRDGTQVGGGLDLSEEGLKNLETLVRLLDEANEDETEKHYWTQWMKADVLRELGEFELASEVLNQITTARREDTGNDEILRWYAQIVRQLRSFCDARDACVKELKF